MESYVGRAKDRSIIEKSSSGGAFTVLSDYFLESGGAVVASVYDYTDNILKFRLITDKAERDKARGSKYFQSTVGDAFQEAKKWLEDNPQKPLMFIGTGCQADGFRSYMEKCHLRDRVTIVDIICYGTPSRGLWREYLQERKPTYLTFKDKRNGWLHPTAVMTVNTKEISIADYTKIFYSKYALRPSCYQCPYTTIERKVDMTIGDSWGIDKKMPDFYDERGNSLFLVHTQQGQVLFDTVKDKLDYRQAMCMQSHLEKPTEKPNDREKFWKIYHEKGLESAMQKMSSFTTRVKHKLGKIGGGCAN